MGTTLGADASVMDYPAPMVQIGSGNTLLETSSYVQEIGVFDKVTIEYGYGPLPADARGSENATREHLQSVIERAEAEVGYVVSATRVALRLLRCLTFVLCVWQFGTDQDNGPRPTPDSIGGLYGFDWRSSQWDNGSASLRPASL